jgi:hypothetical protein
MRNVSRAWAFETGLAAGYELGSGTFFCSSSLPAMSLWRETRRIKRQQAKLTLVLFLLHHLYTRPISDFTRLNAIFRHINKSHKCTRITRE